MLETPFAYGAKCLGMPDKDLKHIRKTLATCVSSSNGSTTLKLAMLKLEPTMELSCAPVQAWSMAIWNRCGVMDLLSKAYRNNVHLALQGSWKKVHCPAGATAGDSGCCNRGGQEARLPGSGPTGCLASSRIVGLNRSAQLALTLL